MKLVSLMYHDVIVSDAGAPSGFLGKDADSYKVGLKEFTEHLAVLKELNLRCLTAAEWLESACDDGFALTFDDGGASAALIADLLDAQGMRGNFLVTTDFLDSNGFLSRADVKMLAQRGHTVGSHSASHPLQMGRCTSRHLDEEWQKSVRCLSDLLGYPIIVGSVPGGYLSRAVIQAAAQAGIRALFTSEPTTRPRLVDGCRVFGRFTVRRWTSPAVVAGLVEGGTTHRMRQLVSWNVRKLAKKTCTGLYGAARQRWFEANPRRSASDRPL